jgi:hypothetical protein
MRIVASEDEKGRRQHCEETDDVINNNLDINHQKQPEVGRPNCVAGANFWGRTAENNVPSVINQSINHDKQSHE